MAEWVDYGSLKGPQGDKGDTGDQGPQGAKGDTGAQGPKGDTGATPVITMTATVDANVGTPSVNIQQGGTAENPTFSLAFANIKGEKGDKGDTGDQGPQGDVGPQGPAGADAQFPTGGEDGQSLVKSAGGYGWADMLPETGGTLTGSVAVDTGTVEPNITLKRTVDGSPCEAIMRIDSEAVAGIRFKVNGETVNNLYLEQTKTRLSKPLDVESGGVPQDGTTGQILKKGASGAEWGDVPQPDMSGYVKYSPEADKLTYDDGTEVSTIRIGDVNSGPYLQMSNNQVGIANRILNQSAGFGIHESSNHPALYLGANQGTTPKSVTGITDSISDSPEGLNLATDKAVASYVTAHAGDALPEGGTDGQVLTKTADGEAWEDVPAPDVSHLLNADVENATVIDPRSVDITTLAPGTYRVTKGAYVDNGETMGTGVNGTQFPDAMIQMNEYSRDSIWGILNVYSLDTDTEYSTYELVIINFRAGGGCDLKMYAYGKKPNVTVMSDEWKLQYPTDIAISIDEDNATAAVTGKSVADYINSLIATDEEFDTYFGLS